MSKLYVFKQFKNKEINVFQAIQILETNIENKKNEGVVYTPKYIADYIIQNINYNLNETIYEPSVGHGIFIFSLLEYIEKEFNMDNHTFSVWFNSKVFANELSSEKVNDFISLLSIYFEHKGIENISFKNITCEDTLTKNYVKKFDVLIGNPPYIRTKNLNSDYLQELRKSFLSCRQGNVDIFYAFIELSTKISLRSSMIVPNSFINNKSAENLRKIIKPYIKEIIDFKSELIFDPVRTYTCIYNLDNNLENNILYSNHLYETKLTFNKNLLSDQHWIFDEQQKEKMLPEKTLIRSGIATLKDKAYIIEQPKYTIINNKEYILHNYNNKEYLIEKEAVISFYKITKMNKQYCIINPYDENFNIIKEDDIQKKYPKLYYFFEEIKNELNMRDKGKTLKYESWYAYGRKQGLFKNNCKYHLLLPLMTTLPMKVSYLETENSFLFTSGYVISSSNQEDIMYIKKILESDNTSVFIKRVGKEWPGKEKYYTYSINQLRNI